MSLYFPNHTYRWFKRPRRSSTHTRVPRRKPDDAPPPPRPAILRPLGAQIRRLRLERGLSQEGLAELAGLNYKYLGRVELAKQEPGADVLVRLAQGLRIPVGALFETITPSDSDPSRISPVEIDGMRSAITALTDAVNRVAARQPPPVALRAPRRRART